ncbi:MAG: hypothetical protein JW904_12930 [Spirochaetales bacterium]|nr:hypothetical protein [Spirochaetales bacterium]
MKKTVFLTAGITVFLLISFITCSPPGGGNTTPGGGGIPVGPLAGYVGFATLNGGTTGGAGGDEVTVSTGTELQNAINVYKSENPTGRAAMDSPRIIYISGSITTDNSPEDVIYLKGSSDTKLFENISIIGVGTSGEFNGIGLKIERAHNIIIQNIAFHHVRAGVGDGDGMGVNGPATNIWVDHCEFYNEVGDLDGDGTIGDGGDKDYYDALLDTKYEGIGYITYSYNTFHDSYKTSLIGYTTDDARDWNITIYRNYYYNCNSRLPLIRGGNVHILNNYYYNNMGSGINLRCGGTVLIEGNYFKDSKDVIGHFYNDPTGYWDLGPGSSDSNIYDNVTWSTIADDIYATAQSEGFADTGTWTPPYSYTALAASEVPAAVEHSTGVGNIDDGIEQTDAQKVAAAKALLSGELLGVYYIDKATTEAAVAAVIAAVEGDFADTVEVTILTDEPGETTTITITSGLESDTIVIQPQTADDKISDAYDLVDTAVSGISYTTAALTLTAAEDAIDSVSAGFATGVSAVAAIDAGNNDNIVITISCAGGTDQTITILAPTSAERVAYAKSVLLGNSAIRWDTDVATTYANVSAAVAITNGDGSLWEATASAAIDGDTVVITITHGIESDTIVLSATVDWVNADIGSAAGVTSESAGTYTITGTGKFESSQQTFRYMYTEITGDFTMTARVESFTATSNQGWAGILMTPNNAASFSTGTDMLFSASIKRGDGTWYYGHRLAAGATLTKNAMTAPSGSGNTYVKLVRTGDSYSASYSLDGGSTWGAATTNSFAAALPATLYVGLCVNSGSSSASATAVFSDVMITQ